MIFQTVPDNLVTDSYCTAWKVFQAPDPGDFYLELPNTFQFYVIDSLNNGERKTGPFKVSYGQAVDVLQTRASDAPTVTIKSDESVPQNQIKVTNLSGNVQKLEMALFKDESKMVFYKNIRPNDFLFMAIRSTVYMSVAVGVTQGEEFPTIQLVRGIQHEGTMSIPRKFKLVADKPVMNITVTQKQAGNTYLRKCHDRGL